MRPAFRSWATLLLACALLPIAESPVSAAGRHRVVRCKGGTCWPAAFTFTPDGGSIFYAERLSGEIRRFTLDGRRDRRWAKLSDVSLQGEQGVLGIALDPAWEQGPRQQWVYVYYTEGHPHRNVIVRLRKRERGGVQRKVLLTIPASDYHDGGVLHFGPDEKLYAVTGDSQNPGLAQQKGNPAGKVLRLEQNGKRPASNPIGGSRAYSYGHRNSFGFAFDPQTGNIWQSENGPECDDEVNLILPGRNYGWGGASSCPDINDSGPNPERPKATFNPVPALTGMAFCEGCGLAAEVEGDLLVGAYNDGKIRNLTLNASRDDVAGIEVLYDHPNSVLAIEAAPDGRIYFSDPHGIFLLR
jgi:glucose/arabinose dehydrogenase